MNSSIIRTALAACLVLLLLSSETIAQVYSDKNASARVAGASLLKLNDKRQTIDYVKLKDAYLISEHENLQWLTNVVLKTNTATSFTLTKKETDPQGNFHYRYKQYYKTLPVEYGVYYVHTKKGLVESANGEYYDKINLSVTPTVSMEKAYARALQEVPSKKYRHDNAGTATTEGQGELLVLPTENGFVLAYKFDIYSLEPLKRVYIYINANNGSKIKEINRIHHSDVQGTAVTAYNGTVSMTTDSISPTSYRLKALKGFNGIHTRNLNNGTNYNAATDFTDTDNLWNVPGLDKYAYDAHFGAEATYDYYFTKYGRNSYDNAGASINSYVHYSFNFVNAFWDGAAMTYGDGDGTTYNPLTSIDIIGHEITHAVTEHTAGLIYSGESGALNESYSDCFGVTIDYFKNPATANFLEGDQASVTGTPFRNMANPNQYNNPDCYNGLYWNNPNEVHNNSGVHNFWYYLLCMGGSGTNDIGNVYTVNSIGMDAANAIIYRSLTTYLTPSSNYADARFYAIQSAVDLYGACSNEVIQVTNAWYAVGVGSFFSNAVIAGFSAAQTYYCAVPSTVNFTNTSINGTTYHWDFGDGDTSALSSPSHIYADSGTYTVTLIVTGNAACGSADTLTYTNYITVVNGGGPISPTCIPGHVSNCCGIGVTNFQFSTINKASAIATEGYKDFTCGAPAVIVAGDPVPVSITTGTTTNENVKAWIDYNNDGAFDPVTETIFTSNNKLTAHSGIVNTSVGAVLNTPLRLRVADDINSSTIVNACTTLQNGQAEDYTVTFIANTQAPDVDFSADFLTINTGGTVTFQDLTQHAPTGWQWSFAGGTPSSSTVHNPSVIYNTVGTYAVTLTATNSFGQDSVTKTAYINVVNSINLCTGITNTTAANGIFYDSGGPSGNYSNSEDCSLLINPGCALSVSLSFTQFSTANSADYLRIYDGVDANGILLINAFGTTIPSTLTASSGKMFIVWHSSSVNISSGWEASWTAVIGSQNPPVAAFNASTLTPPLFIPAQFTDATTNNPVAWHWDFGDGQTATVQNPAHAYILSGNHTVTLIATNCVTSDTITQIINVQGAPVISVNPDSLSVSLSCNDSITIPVTIYNTGTGDLVFTTSNSGNGISGDTAILVIQETPTWSLWMSDFLQTEFNITPTVISSTQIATTDFSLYDIIITVGAQSTAYYNTISANVSKFEAFVNAGGILQYQMATFSGVNDINLVGGGVMTYGPTQNVNTGLVLSHPILNGISNPLNGNSANHCHISTLPPNAIEITETGTGSLPTTIEYNYGNGLVIATGMTWEYLFNNNYNTAPMLPNSISYILSGSGGSPDWISVSTEGDTIAPGDSLVIDVTVNSNGLSAGVYDGAVTFSSNDPLHPELTLPVHLLVAGSPALALSDSCIDFGTITQYTSASDSISISNSGCDTLHITSIVSSNAAYTSTVNTLNIPPYQSKKISVIFNPQVIGSIAATLTLFNNDHDTTICLNGISAEGPAIIVNPDSISVILSCNDSVVIPVIIYNNGGMDLDFSINNSGNGISGDTSVLVIQETSAWSVMMADFLQTNYNITATVITASQIASTDFSDYDVIITTSAQSTAYYNAISSNVAKFSAFVAAGGILQYQMAAMSGITPVNLVGGGVMTYGNNENQNTGLILSHPLLAGISNPLMGNNANHCYLSTLPAGAVQITKTSVSSLPTTVEYAYGDGLVIATGMTWEYLHANNYNSGAMLPNSVSYIFSKLGSLAEWVSVSDDSDTLPPADSAVVYVTVKSHGLSGGTYTTNLLFNSNDPLHPVDSVIVTLNVTFDPCPDFVFQAPSICSGIVSFEDSTTNNPTSWQWDFGDGTYSALQNPSHTYTSAGTFQVKLVACNGISCDSITKQVVISAIGGPITSCSPQTTGYCCSMGITNVTFNTINNNSPDASEGYKDYTCTTNTTVLAGQSYPITITTGPTYYENVGAWIDFNNDGVFDVATETVFTSTNTLTNHTGNIYIPNSALGNTALRFRIADNYTTSPAPSPCTDIQYGQFEDYTIFITPNVSAPVAYFSAVSTPICNGTIQFTDSSTNNPTAWLWDFGDGNTSALQNPQHYFSIPGTHTVTLTASNAFGIDITSQTINVSVFPVIYSVSGNLVVNNPVQFTLVTPPGVNWVWDFGDGNGSNLQSPSHIYTAPGTYPVSVEVSSGPCLIMRYDTLVILPVGINEFTSSNSFQAFPNPFSKELNITYKLSSASTVSLKVVDMLGQTIEQFETEKLQQAGNYSYSFASDKAAVYFVYLNVNGFTEIYKVVKM